MSETDIRHGQDGWDLVEYDWADATGEATCLYERSIKGVPEARTVVLRQPSGPWHNGWLSVVLF